MRRARPALITVLISMSLLIISVFAPAPALADEEASLPGVSDPQSRPSLFAKASSSHGIEVSINSLSPRVMKNNEDLVISGALRNTSGRTLTTPAILVSMSTTPPSSVMDLEEELDVDAQIGSTISATNLEMNLEADASHRFELRISAENLPFDDESAWGPRALTVEVFSDGASGRDATIALWDSGADFAPSRLSALIPWTSVNSEGEEEERRAALAIASIPGATLAMDAALLPSLPQKDEEITEQKTREKVKTDEAFLRSLLTPGREIVALPRGDADPGTVTLAGNSELSTRLTESIESFPASIAELRKLSAKNSDDEASPEGSQSSQSGAQSSSSSDSSESQGGNVNANGQGNGVHNDKQMPPASPSQDSQDTEDEDAASASIIRHVAWPSAYTFGTWQLEAAKNGVSIAPLGRLEPDEDLDFTSLALAEVDTTTGEISMRGASEQSARVLIPNVSLSQILDWQTTNTADELDAEQALQAITAIIAHDRPSSSRTVFLTSDRSTAPNADLAVRVRALFDSPWVTGISFSDIAESEPTDVERMIVEPGALSWEGATAVSTLSDALASAYSFANATSDPKEALAEIEGEILPVISARFSPDEQLTAASQFSARVSGLRSRVATEPAGAVNLINKSADFPVRVRNDLPLDVTVKVTLLPSDARLRIAHSSEVTLLAGAVSTVTVPVEAIGSGDVEVTYRITTPDGSVLEDSRKVLVRLRAGWEDAITISAAAAFALLFIFGLVRTLRQRLDKRNEESTASPGSPQATEEHDPLEADSTPDGDSNTIDQQMGS
ncbi:DUF6049 family protein [Schaalia cardiffensis]